MANKIRTHAIISGKVQGVCFRMETKKKADRNNVYGWVKNRSDGTVEALFEGDKKEVDSVVKWCEQGPMFSNVSAVDTEIETYAGEFVNFKILY